LNLAGGLQKYTVVIFRFVVVICLGQILTAGGYTLPHGRRRTTQIVGRLVGCWHDIEVTMRFLYE